MSQLQPAAITDITTLNEPGDTSGLEPRQPSLEAEKAEYRNTRLTLKDSSSITPLQLPRAAPTYECSDSGDQSAVT